MHTHWAPVSRLSVSLLSVSLLSVSLLFAVAACESAGSATPVDAGPGGDDVGAIGAASDAPDTTSSASDSVDAGSAGPDAWDAGSAGPDTADASSAGSDALDASVGTSDASPATDTPPSLDASCNAGGKCGMGEFCNSLGHCCPGLGCAPQCPNGILIDANGCDTCQCAPVQCNPLSMGPKAQCKASEYCQLPLGQCGGSAGTCQVKDPICNAIAAPVCGCDKQTYSNACMAASAGVSVASTGACK